MGTGGTLRGQKEEIGVWNMGVLRRADGMVLQSRTRREDDSFMYERAAD